MTRRLTVRQESWPLKQPFVISRLRQETAELVVVEIEQDGLVGRGETERAEAFDPDAPPVAGEIERARREIEQGITRYELLSFMPAGNARTAVDCALWDLEAKAAGRPAWELAGLEAPGAITTAYTLSLGTPEAMAAEATRNAKRPLLKLKLGGADDLERVAAVRAAAPDCRLIADANEGWQESDLADFLQGLAAAGVALIEQPLPAGRDAALIEVEHPLPVCADESFQDRASLPALAGRYDYVNIKLDKAGGLTEALAAARAAQAAGFRLMLGCNVGTSLAMAPACLLAGLADFVDLDGPLLLARDRTPGLTYNGSIIEPPKAELWG